LNRPPKSFRLCSDVCFRARYWAFGTFGPEYQDSMCLAGLGIRPRYSGSISNVCSNGKKTGQMMSRGSGGDWVGIRLASVDSLPTPIRSHSKTEAEVRNPTVAGGGSGSLPSWPPAIHLRLRTAPPGSPLPSNPSEPTSPVVSPSRPSHFLYFRGRFGRCSGDHLPSSGDLRTSAQVCATSPFDLLSLSSVWSCSLSLSQFI
jgi:hypothetical protein